MLKMIDVLQRQDFRTGLISAINPYIPNYSLPQTIPLLYRYCRFSKYSVANIQNHGVSLSLIGTYNDCYDSTISFGDIKQRAAEEYEKDLRICSAAGCSPCLSADDWYEHIVQEQEAYRGFSNDSHCCCFSESASSTLMWSHYANNNRGICIEYDFESIKGHPFYSSLFPVAYTEKPVNVYDFVHENKGAFSVETGVLVSVLNKAKCWAYEKEWRLILLNERIGQHKVDMYPTFNGVIAAKRIILGQHFLDNFIPELNNGDSTLIEESLKLLRELAAYLKAQSIPVYQAISVADTFDQFTSKLIDLDMLICFIEEYIELDEFTLQNRNYLYIAFHEELLAK